MNRYDPWSGFRLNGSKLCLILRRIGEEGPINNPKVSPRFSPNNVLFTTDFSAASKTALPYARAIARWYGSKILVCYVVPSEEQVSGPLSQQDLTQQEAEQSMASFLRSSPFPDVAYDVVIEKGELWKTLAAVINRHKIDIIVLGTHGRHGIKKLILGSAAETIFRQAPCPVLTVGPGAMQKASEFESLKRILFATDFSANSLHALPYALSLAEENQANIILLHLIPLMPMNESPESVIKASRERLQALLPPEAGNWCTPEFVVRSEFPPKGILQVASENHVDLIVMGVHQADTQAASGHIPWAIASEVACQALCPLLTIRS